MATENRRGSQTIVQRVYILDSFEIDLFLKTGPKTALNVNF